MAVQKWIFCIFSLVFTSINAEEDPLWYQLLKDSVIMDEERESEVLIFFLSIYPNHTDNILELSCLKRRFQFLVFISPLLLPWLWQYLQVLKSFYFPLLIPAVD